MKKLKLPLKVNEFGCVVIGNNEYHLKITPTWFELKRCVHYPGVIVPLEVFTVFRSPDKFDTYKVGYEYRAFVQDDFIFRQYNLKLNVFEEIPLVDLFELIAKNKI